MSLCMNAGAAPAPSNCVPMRRRRFTGCPSSTCWTACTGRRISRSCRAASFTTISPEGEIMGHYAWVLEVRPGCEEEYKQAHDEIWPEMLDTLKAAGIRNYSIFRLGLKLIGYFETDDLQKTIAYLKDDPVNKRWGEAMAP